MTELRKDHCQKVGPGGTLELTEANRECMVRTEIARKCSRIVEIDHHMRTNPATRGELRGVSELTRRKRCRMKHLDG